MIGKRRVHISILSIMAVVLLSLLSGASTVSAQEPDYSDIDDLLEGDWTLFQHDDLVIANPIRDKIDLDAIDTRNLILTTDDRTIDSQSIQGLTKPKCEARDPNLQVFPQQTRVGRFFNAEYDVIITLAPTKDAAGSGCVVADGVDNMAFFVRDRLTPANNGTYPISLSSTMVQAGQADFDQDGYDDLLIINDEVIFAVTAGDVNTPTAGLQFGAAVTIDADQKPLNDPAAGDFNDDGLADVAWIGGDIPVPYDPLSPIPFAVHFATVCPDDIADTVCEGADPLDIVLSPLASSPIDIDLGNSQEPCFPATGVAAGNFASTAGDELLLAVPVPANVCRIRSEIYAFNSVLTPTRKSANNGVLPNNPLMILPDAVFAGSGNFDGVGSLDDAVIATEVLGNAVLTVITVDDDGSQTLHTATTDNTTEGNLYGLAVGRYTPLANQTSAAVDANLQVATLFDNKVHVYAVPAPDSYTPQRVLHQPLNDYLDPFGRIIDSDDGGYTFNGSGSWLHAGDLQARSLRVGPPYVIRAEGHSQPDVILAHPPMHVDYIQPSVETSETPVVFNFSVLPESYNAQYQVESSEESKSTRESKSSYAYSTEETADEKITIKVPLVSKIKTETKQAWEQEHEKVKSEQNLNYSSTEFDATSKTGFGDVLWVTTNRFNIYVYPALGQSVCPANNPDCTPPEEQPLNLMISGPDTISRQRLTGPLVEWYQPIHEPGQLLSYPWTLDQLKARNSGLALLTADSPPGFATDDSEQEVEVKWTVGSESESSTETTKTHSFETDNSVTAGSASVFGAKVKVEAGFDYSNSSATSSLQTSSNSLAASSGIGIDKPGTFVNPGLYAYRVQPYIFGTTLPAGVVQPIGDGADITTTGTLETGYTVDPLAPTGTGAWWSSGAYVDNLDVALNHPQRWDIPPNKTSGGLECLRDSLSSPGETCVEFNSPNPEDLWQSQFHQMRGLLVTVNGVDGPQRTQAIDGDQIHLTARVYNYSLRDMDAGTQVHVRFYRQEWNPLDNTPVGDSVLIEENVIGRIPGFDTSSALPNWTTTSVAFDSTDLGDKNFIFWVLVWMEDGSGLVEELAGHGLSQAPGELSSIYDTPLEAITTEGENSEPITQTFSNNVGYLKSVFFVAPATTSESTAPVESAALGMTLQEETTSTLFVNEMSVMPTTVELGDKVTVSANLGSNGEPSNGVVIYLHDDDPAADDTLFDVEMLSHIRADEHHNVRVPYRATTCGTNYITLIALSGAGHETRESVSFDVSCEPVENAYEVFLPMLVR